MKFFEIVYIRVRRDTIFVRNIDTNAAANASANFSTTRLLVGDFVAAEKLLRTLMSELCPWSFFKAKPTIVLHPMEMVEGGLSQVEVRVFTELALGAGAYRAFVHIGDELDDGELRRLVDAKKV